MGSGAIGHLGVWPWNGIPPPAGLAVVRAPAGGTRQNLVGFVDFLESGCASRAGDLPVHVPGKLMVGGADSRLGDSSRETPRTK